MAEDGRQYAVSLDDDTIADDTVSSVGTSTSVSSESSPSNSPRGRASSSYRPGVTFSSPLTEVHQVEFFSPSAFKIDSPLPQSPDTLRREREEEEREQTTLDRFVEGIHQETPEQREAQRRKEAQALEERLRFEEEDRRRRNQPLPPPAWLKQTPAAPASSVAASTAPPAKFPTTPLSVASTSAIPFSLPLSTPSSTQLRTLPPTPYALQSFPPLEYQAATSGTNSTPANAQQVYPQVDPRFYAYAAAAAAAGYPLPSPFLFPPSTPLTNSTNAAATPIANPALFTPARHPSTVSQSTPLPSSIASTSSAVIVPPLNFSGIPLSSAQQHQQPLLSNLFPYASARGVGATAAVGGAGFSLDEAELDAQIAAAQLSLMEDEDTLSKLKLRAAERQQQRLRGSRREKHSSYSGLASPRLGAGSSSLTGGGASSSTSSSSLSSRASRGVSPAPVQRSASAQAFRTPRARSAQRGYSPSPSGRGMSNNTSNAGMVTPTQVPRARRRSLDWVPSPAPFGRSMLEATMARANHAQQASTPRGAAVAIPVTVNRSSHHLSSQQPDTPSLLFAPTASSAMKSRNPPGTPLAAAPVLAPPPPSSSTALNTSIQSNASGASNVSSAMHTPRGRSRASRDEGSTTPRVAFGSSNYTGRGSSISRGMSNAPATPVAAAVAPVVNTPTIRGRSTSAQRGGEVVTLARPKVRVSHRKVSKPLNTNQVAAMAAQPVVPQSTASKEVEQVRTGSLKKRLRTESNSMDAASSNVEWGMPPTPTPMPLNILLAQPSSTTSSTVAASQTAVSVPPPAAAAVAPPTAATEVQPNVASVAAAVTPPPMQFAAFRPPTSNTAPSTAAAVSTTIPATTINSAAASNLAATVSESASSNNAVPETLVAPVTAPAVAASKVSPPRPSSANAASPPLLQQQPSRPGSVSPFLHLTVQGGVSVPESDTSETSAREYIPEAAPSQVNIPFAYRTTSSQRKPPSPSLMSHPLHSRNGSNGLNFAANGSSNAHTNNNHISSTATSNSKLHTSAGGGVRASPTKQRTAEKIAREMIEKQMKMKQEKKAAQMQVENGSGEVEQPQVSNNDAAPPTEALRNMSLIASPVAVRTAAKNKPTSSKPLAATAVVIPAAVVLETQQRDATTKNESPIQLHSRKSSKGGAVKALPLHKSNPSAELERTSVISTINSPSLAMLASPDFIPSASSPTAVARVTPTVASTTTVTAVAKPVSATPTSNGTNGTTTTAAVAADISPFLATTDEMIRSLFHYYAHTIEASSEASEMKNGNNMAPSKNTDPSSNYQMNRTDFFQFIIECDLMHVLPQLVAQFANNSYSSPLLGSDDEATLTGASANTTTSPTRSPLSQQQNLFQTLWSTYSISAPSLADVGPQRVFSFESFYDCLSHMAYLLAPSDMKRAIDRENAATNQHLEAGTTAARSNPYHHHRSQSEVTVSQATGAAVISPSSSSWPPNLNPKQTAELFIHLLEFHILPNSSIYNPRQRYAPPLPSDSQNGAVAALRKPALSLSSPLSALSYNRFKCPPSLALFFLFHLSEFLAIYHRFIAPFLPPPNALELEESSSSSSRISSSDREKMRSLTLETQWIHLVRFAAELRSESMVDFQTRQLERTQQKQQHANGQNMDNGDASEEYNEMIHGLELFVSDDAGDSAENDVVLTALSHAALSYGEFTHILNQKHRFDEGANALVGVERVSESVFVELLLVAVEKRVQAYLPGNSRKEKQQASVALLQHMFEILAVE